MRAEHGPTAGTGRLHTALPAWSLFPARRTLRRMSPLDALGFAPMASDMERVEAALRASVRDV